MTSEDAVSNSRRVVLYDDNLHPVHIVEIPWDGAPPDVILFRGTGYTAEGTYIGNLPIYTPASLARPLGEFRPEQRFSARPAHDQDFVGHGYQVWDSERDGWWPVLLAPVTIEAAKATAGELNEIWNRKVEERDQ